MKLTGSTFCDAHIIDWSGQSMISNIQINLRVYSRFVESHFAYQISFYGTHENDFSTAI